MASVYDTADEAFKELDDSITVPLTRLRYLYALGFHESTRITGVFRGSSFLGEIVCNRVWRDNAEDLTYFSVPIAYGGGVADEMYFGPTAVTTPSNVLHVLALTAGTADDIQDYARIVNYQTISP